MRSTNKVALAVELSICSVFANAHYKLKFNNRERLSGRSDDSFVQTFSYLHILKMRSKKKVALVVELSICSFSIGKKGKQEEYQI